jgi:hypothetical protein
MPRADAPAPLSVGVLVKNERYDFVGMNLSTERVEAYRGRAMLAPMFQQLDDRGAAFVRALRESGAFRKVDEVRSLGFEGEGGDDILLDAHFAGRYTQDAGAFGKAFITGFLLFLPAPFITYDDRFEASADVSVYDAAGRLLHRYEENQAVAMNAWLFSEGMPSSLALGIEDASANMTAKLVEAIISDRGGWKRATRRAAAPPAAAEAPAASAPAPESAPAQASASAPEPVPAAAPAEAPAAPPAPAPAAPLSAAKAAAIDDQLLP